MHFLNQQFGPKGHAFSFFFKVISLALVKTLCLNGVLAQEEQVKKSGITFNGTSTISGYYSNRTPFGQDIPPEYLNWHLRGNLNLAGIPLQISSLLTTQQRPERQSMNHFSIRIDTRSLIRQPELSQSLPFLKYVETFEVGRTRPDYSQLMLSGIPLNGINIALRGFGFHLAFAYGNSQRAVNRGSYLSQQYKQEMIFGRIGFGRKDENYLNISMLRAKDDPNSIEANPTFYVREPYTFVHNLDTFFIPLDSVPVVRKPRETLMSGVELGLSLFNHKLKLHGEVVGSVNTSNAESETIPVNEIPDWIMKLHEPRLTTSLSYAFGFRSALDLKTTRVQASMRRTAPGFQSPGTPFMRQDNFNYEIRANQLLFSRKLSVQPYFRWFRDNLSGQKAQTTYTQVWGINSMWRPAGLPYLGVNYSPHKQETRHEDFAQTNLATVLTISSGRNYRINDLAAFTGLSWSNQQIKSKFETGERVYTGNNFSLQQSLRLRVPITFNATAGYYIFETDESTSNSYQLALRANYQYERKWNAGMGVRYLDQNSDRKRTGITANFRYSFGKFGEVNLSAEPALYRDLLDPEREYDEFVVRVSFTNKW